MRMITGEVEQALSNGLYYLAVSVALALPDICAALESADGQASGPKYKAWYRQWIGDLGTVLTPNDCYSLRCGVVHQGRFGHRNMQFSRVIFVLPNPSLNIGTARVITNDALNLGAVGFCQTMIEAVSQWAEATKTHPNVIANLPRLVQMREQGLAPYVVGVPVIA